MRTIIIIVFAIVAILIGVYYFYKKSYIRYELVYEIPNAGEDFRPLAYVFFHSENDLKRYFRINTATKEIEKKTSNVKFEFNRYSYCIFFGRRITKMEYSQKQRYFDDPTPSYARTRGKIPVFVKYESGDSIEKGTFIYRVPKDERLRGFYD